MRINDSISVLTSTYLDWDNILVNPNYARMGLDISWNGYEPYFLSDPITPAEIVELADRRQYTFQILEDGSLLQIYYSYFDDGETIKSARLAFYESPTGNLIEACSGYENEEDPYQLSLRNTNDQLFLRWLRIDYNANAGKGILHHDCHMHIAGFPNTRLAVRGLPTPKQFLEFILASCYSDIYREHRLNEDGAYKNSERMRELNSPSLLTDDNESFSYMSHLCIPNG